MSMASTRSKQISGSKNEWGKAVREAKDMDKINPDK